VALTRLCRFCLLPLATECICNDAEDPTAVPSCCDLHGPRCEPPGDLCCEGCTEARHGAWIDACQVRRYGHPPGEACSAPDAPPPPGITPDWRQA
jgi:hypothetical protein